MVAMMNTNNKKRGFSLTETLVSMLVVSIFFVAASKIITHRPPKEIQTPPHGFFECYYIGGQLYSHSVRGNADEPEHRTTNCNFQPPLGLSFINVHYISYDDERYFNSVEPLYDRRMELSRPSDIEAYYSQYNDEDSNNRTDVYENQIEEFFTYLAKTHPRSKIYEQYNDGDLSSNALFISW